MKVNLINVSHMLNNLNIHSNMRSHISNLNKDHNIQTTITKINRLLIIKSINKINHSNSHIYMYQSNSHSSRVIKKCRTQ